MIRSELDEQATQKYVRVRARALQKFLSVIERDLEKKGIRCEMKTWLSWEFGPGIAYAVVHVEAAPVEIDAAKVLPSKVRRSELLYNTRTYVGGVRSSFIKQMEAEAVWEDERGGEAPLAKEAMGAAEEGGGEEAAGGAGVAPLGYREAVERGCVRLHEAVLRYRVPLHQLVPVSYTHLTLTTKRIV